LVETVIGRYRELVAAGDILQDPEQELGAEKLQILCHRLSQYDPGQGTGWRQFLMRRSKREPAPEGLYIFGDVGRGKSMLMDLFFAVAPLEKKRRVHFHEFMREVHARINEFRRTGRERRDGDDPVPPTAQAIADETWLLCFDEFEVRDIADAMLLGRLFTHLFEQGVVVVATSNRAPEDLYKNGLNRNLFLPFIDLLKEKLDIYSLNGPVDYRLSRLKGIPVYHTPLDEAAEKALDAAFLSLTDQEKGSACELEVMKRRIRVPEQANGTARFSFADLCEQPLAANDYLAIAEAFHTVILSGIPKLDPGKRNEARRFVLLIDVLYDNGVKLVASAATPVDQIYPAGDGAFEFERTASRLIEMQSAEYIDRPHS
jgi:cell division protein ZapE